MAGLGSDGEHGEERLSSCYVESMELGTTVMERGDEASRKFEAFLCGPLN